MPVNAVRLPAAEAAKSTSSRNAGAGASSHAAGSHVAASHAASSHDASSNSALSECVSATVRRYLADIGDTECAEGLHAMVLREVELPLLREVLAFHDGNQSRAAAALGINRATLRKKLATHGLI